MSKLTEGFKGITKKPWIPKPYQTKGIAWLTSRPAAALFWAPGLGKTTTVLRAFQELRKRKLAKTMLLIAPLRVCQGVWRQERDKWLGFEDLKIGFAHGPDKAKILHEGSYDVILLNYDGIAWACEHLKKGMFDVVCFDELTRMKHSSSERFKKFKKMLAFFRFRWGLTGTPAPNGLLDLFGQIYMLDGGQRLGYGITKYRQTYFHQQPWDQWTWYPNVGADKKIAKLLSNIANYVDEKDWNKMPALINMPVTVQLPPPAMKLYKTLEKEFIAKLEEGVVTAATAAVLSLKLRQCASGQVYDEGRNIMNVHEAKLDALEDLVEEMAGDPMIIAVGFLHEVEAIRKRLGKNIPYIGGGVTTTELNKTIERWNLGWLPILLAHPTSVAHGLNLQNGGRAICWYTLTWNLEEYLQLIRRVYRQGQTRKVLNYLLLAEGTMDTFVYKTLFEKTKGQGNLLNHLRRYYAA